MTRRWIACGLVLLPLAVSTTRARADEDDSDNFRPDVFACEEAVSRLDECCPDFEPKLLRCVHSKKSGSSSCGYNSWSMGEEPTITIAESECIFAMSCEALIATKVCERAARARPNRGYSSTTEHGMYPGASESEQKQGPVCP